MFKRPPTQWGATDGSAPSTSVSAEDTTERRATLQRQQDSLRDRLVALFNEVVEEPLPSGFHDLLARLRENDADRTEKS